jgi:hypothetical protein
MKFATLCGDLFLSYLLYHLLNFVFREDWNRSIDDIRKQLNFESNLALLQACSDRIVIIKEEQYMLYPIEDETTEHQMGLINATKEK